MARARAYAGSDSNSSRVTCSARMKADASWTNGYFARPASSTVEGTHVRLKRPRRGTVNVESPDDIANAPSVGRRSFRNRTMFSPDGGAPRIFRCHSQGLGHATQAVALARGLRERRDNQ